MKDEQKRFGKGFAVALAVHLVLAAGLGIFGYRFVHTPPEILEVSLEGGGGGAEAQEEEIEQEEQQEEPIIQSLEDIIDQKLKPKPQKKVVRKKATAASGPKAPAGNPAGSGTGTGTGTGTGSGSGSGRMLCSTGFRYRRFHSTACILLRCRRHEANLWNCIPLRTDCLWFLSGSDRTDCKRCDRLCNNLRSNCFL